MGCFGVANHASLKAYNIWAKRNPEESLPPPRENLVLSFDEAVEQAAAALRTQARPLKGRTVVAGVWFDPARAGYAEEELAGPDMSSRVLRELQLNLANYVDMAPHMPRSKAGVYFYEGITTEGPTRAVCLLLFRRLPPL